MSPEEVNFFSDKTIIQISLGGYHSLALDNKGQLYSWGRNYDGQLAHGDRKDRSEPSIIPYFKENGVYITQVTSAHDHSLALDNDGNVYFWGYNAPMEGGRGYYHVDHGVRSIPVLIDFFKENRISISKLSAAGRHSLALDDKGNIYSSCRYPSGPLDRNDRCLESHLNEPIIMSFFKNNNIIIKDISTGSDHSLALDSKGNVYTWGNIPGNSVYITKPTLISVLRGKEVTDIYSGAHHNIVKTKIGDIYVWGSNLCGQLVLEKESLDQIEFLAEKGHSLFQYKLGLMYEKGNNVPQNYEKAFHFFEKAAEQGFPDAKKKLEEITCTDLLYDPYLDYRVEKLRNEFIDLAKPDGFMKKLEDSIVEELANEVKNTVDFENAFNSLSKGNKNPLNDKENKK